MALNIQNGKNFIVFFDRTISYNLDGLMEKRHGDFKEWMKQNGVREFRAIHVDGLVVAAA